MFQYIHQFSEKYVIVCCIFPLFYNEFSWLYMLPLLLPEFNLPPTYLILRMRAKAVCPTLIINIFAF